MYYLMQHFGKDSVRCRHRAGENTNGALEDTCVKKSDEKDLLKSMGIREHIADIVEGGKDAFKKREEKYGFN